MQLTTTNTPELTPLSAGIPRSRLSGIYKTIPLLALSAILAGCQIPAPETYSSYPKVTATGSTPAQFTAEQSMAEQANKPATADPTSILSDDQLQSIYSQARGLVETYFNISLATVTLHIVNNQELEKEVHRETRVLVQPQFSNPDYANLFLSKLMQDQAGTYAALYTNNQTRVLINRSLLDVFISPMATQPGLARQAIMALLIHESVHAADDQMHNIHDRRELNFRASFSQSAAYEGHAQLVTREICTNHQCSKGLAELDNFMFDAPEPEDALARSMQAVSRNVLEYSYVEGERFLEKLKQRKNGAELIASVLRSPPADPVQILDPDNYPDNARVTRNQAIFDTLTSLDHSWTRAPWALVETSPIKGLDMRNDPERREATVDGFTRLIVSMIGAQFFDQSGTSITPIELTVMQTDEDATAGMFAESFHERAKSALQQETGGNILNLVIGQRDSQLSWPMQVFLTEVPMPDSGQNGNTLYSTLIARSGSWIVQLGGQRQERNTDMIELAERLMTRLRLNASAANSTLAVVR